MIEQRPLKVFLCHASADKPAVRKLHRYLKQRGVSPWLDEVDLLPGENWEVEIPRALFESDVILACLSKNSVDKEGYVQKEITFVLDKAMEKPEGTIFIIPVKLEECNVPPRLNRYQWVDLYREDGRKRLMMSLNKRAAQLGPAINQASVLDDTADTIARKKTEREAAEKAARKKAEHDARAKAERAAAEKLALEKIERENASLVDSAIRPKKVNDNAAVFRRPFVIKPREPWELPDRVVEIPSPSRLPAAPAPLNMSAMVLPPILMLVAVGILWLVMQSSSSGINPVFYLMMPLMGMGAPIAQYYSHKNQTKKYQQAMRDREWKYRAVLADTRAKLDALVKQQQDVLSREYPLLPRLVQTGLGISHQKRLWWRRMADPDFLSLRMGTGSDHASFTVAPPRVTDPEDPLAPLAQEVAQAYQEIPDVPLLLDMLKVGSVGLADHGGEAIYGLARRLILDVIIHHSPQDVQLVVLADTPQAQDRWDWLKWTPHTHAIQQGESNRRLAFSVTAIDKSVEWLMSEFEGRRKSEPGVKKRNTSQSAIVVLLDDSGDIRRTEDIRQLAESGREADIYLVFVGGRNWPRECRAKIDVSEGGFKYTETFAGEGGGKRLRGQTEPASLLDCERVARALAGWEISVL